jgi:hypothetical protein
MQLKELAGTWHLSVAKGLMFGTIDACRISVWRDDIAWPTISLTRIR